MKLFLKLKSDILGYSQTSEIKTDPPMGCGQGDFYPTPAYAVVEDLFRRATIVFGAMGKSDPVMTVKIQKEIKDLQLTLETEEGELLELLGLGVTDVREEMPEIPLMLEIIGLENSAFARLFPGHYAAYEDSFKPGRRDDKGGLLK